MNNLSVKITADGSYTIFNKELNEHYHSIHGAKQEANHVFIKNGLNYFIENYNVKTINLLEVGFGTGLNCWLTINHLIKTKKNIKLNYFGVDPKPIDIKMIKKLNHQDQNEIYSLIHESDWNKTIKITPNISLVKTPKNIQNFQHSNHFEIIYFDAFGPRVEEKLWNKDVLKLMYNFLDKNGIMVTYCAKGQVRRDLLEIGFKVERLPGPPGKREMLRAIK